jgi:hypothetical protein
VVPITCQICTCSGCDSSCCLILCCQGRASWGQCLPASVIAGVRCTRVLFPHPCGSSWAQQGCHAVNFHHNHDVLVALLRMCRELTCLIGEHGFAYHVCFGVDVSNFLTVALGGVASFQRRCFGFGGAHVLSCLI